MVHSYHGILLRTRERERIIDTGYNLGEAQENYGEWKKKAINKDCILYDSIYETFLK